ncbi:unnamed protein product [Malus baccata var. baccata]
MVNTGLAQEATAMTILEHSPANSPAAVDVAFRHETRVRYKKWLWWTRFATVITVLQFIGASYLLYNMASHMSDNGTSSHCNFGSSSNNISWKQHLLGFFLLTVCFAALLQCFTGTDILRWRSFYATEDDAWKAHYREVFDHGLREALCCMGRVKYLSVLEEDEVFSVARLLGDLVAYRAAGTGHLELMAGLALLRNQTQSPKSFEDCMDIPEEKIREAADLHKFAEAAYTGPLLDFGRNPFLFPCAWLYRQGILTPWTRNSRFWPSVKAFLYEVPMLGWIIRFLINFRAVMLDVYVYNSSCLIGFPDSSEAEQGLSNWLLMGLRFHHQMSEKEEETSSTG